ncbi:MAG: iron ABC transporter permease [Marinifilaceae bacterium]|jgi:iron complex transport system permease protein
MFKIRDFVLLIAVSLLLLSLFILNIAVGSVDISLEKILELITGSKIDDISTNIIINSRLPQAITACLAGAALSIGGLQMQTLFRNPLAGPSILGVSSGASLGVAFVILASGSIGGFAINSVGLFGNIAVTLAAFIGAISVLLFVVFLARKVKGNATLLIMGIMLGQTASAIVSMLKFYSLEEDVHAYVIWGFGSFSKISTSHMMPFASIIIIAILSSFFLIKKLNLLMLGENYAMNLGLNIKRARLYIIISAGILTATVTAYCGPIVFIGLAVPHIARFIFMVSDHRVLLPATALLGSCVALFCSLIARMPGFDGALPINSVTSLVGVPVVVWVLLSKKKSEIVD